MTIQDLGAIGELIGALATLATLVYIAVQVRQNTEQVRDSARAVRVASLDRTVESFSRYRGMLAQEENATLYARGLDSYASFDPAEKIRFRAMIEEYFFSFQTLYQRIDEELYEREVWERQSQAPAALITTSGGTEWWAERKGIFSKEFQDDLERTASSFRRE